jgi:hypothetical protein
MKELEAETGSVLRGACKSYEPMTPSPRLHQTNVFEAMPRPAVQAAW